MKTFYSHISFEFFHCFNGTHFIHVVKRHNNSYSYKLWRYIRYIIDFNREIDLSLSFLSFKTLVNDLRHVMKNLFFALCVNKGADNLPGNLSADQRLCFHV